MKNLFVFVNGESIFLNDAEVVELIKLSDFNKEVEIKKKWLNESFSNLNIDNYLYLWNFIIFNNLGNYIIDKCKNEKFEQILFDEKLKTNGKQIIRVVGELTIEDILGNIVTCLINSNAYLNGEIKIDYAKVEPVSVENAKQINLSDIIFYTPDGLNEMIEKLKVDLIAFKYFGPSQLSENGRYILPIYLDTESLISKNIMYQDYLANWASVAYLKMLVKIHDFFLDYYKFDSKEGLVNDDIMLALIALTEYEIKDFPKGLQKSIEVGRSTKGKCYFIDTIVTPIAITQDLAMVLQSKDLYSIVTRMLKLIP